MCRLPALDVEKDFRFARSVRGGHAMLSRMQCREGCMGWGSVGRRIAGAMDAAVARWAVSPSSAVTLRSTSIPCLEFALPQARARVKNVTLGR